MQTAIFSLFLFLLVGCSQVEPQKTEATAVEPQQPDPNEVQLLIDKTYKDMIFVKGGSFMMGDPVEPFVDALGKDAWTQYFGSDRNVPVHKVTLNIYYLDAYEVTYNNYDIYTKATNQPLVNNDIRQIKHMYSPQRPVGIGWNGAYNYCQWLGKQTGLSFDLPTEAQWEYAARNRGKTVVFATNTGKIERGVNFPPSIRFPIEIGQFPPSPLGFYDLSGKAFEWVKDWYAKDYYSYSPEKTHKVLKLDQKKYSEVVVESLKAQL